MNNRITSKNNAILAFIIPIFLIGMNFSLLFTVGDLSSDATIINNNQFISAKSLNREILPNLDNSTQSNGGTTTSTDQNSQTTNNNNPNNPPMGNITKIENGNSHSGSQSVKDGIVQYQFQNNFYLNFGTSSNINLDASMDPNLSNRFIGVNLVNQEQVNITFQAKEYFSTIPNGNLTPYSQIDFQNYGSISQITNILNPQLKNIFINQLNYHPYSAEKDNDNYEPIESYDIEYTLDTFYQMEFDGEFDSIELYTLLESQYGINPSSGQIVSFAIYNNVTSSWQILDTLQTSTNVSTTINSEDVKDNQLIFTLVYINSAIIPIPFWQTSYGIFIIIIAAVLVIFGSIMTVQEYRSYLLNRFLPINKGPHRLSMEDVLENENRIQIIDIILSQPGIHFNELLRETQISAGTLAWHLDILETFKIIKKQRVGQYLLYYSYIEKNPISKLDPVLQKSRTTLEILQMVSDHPGIYQNQIAKRMDLDHKTIKYHLDKLLEADLIYLSKIGRKNLFYPQTPSIIDEPINKYPVY